MGHPTDIFLKKPDDSIICAICFEVLDDPASFKECGHTFCEDCIEGCLSSDNHTCPTCRKSICTGSNPTYIVRDLISKLEVRCPNSLLGSDDSDCDNNSDNDPLWKRLKPTVDESDGHNNETSCEWKGTLGMLSQHLGNDCLFATIECGEEGCKYSCQRRHMASHKTSQQGIIAHMKLKHQNELTAMKLECEDKLAAMKEKLGKRCESLVRRIVELEEQISVDPSDNDVVREITVEGAGLQEVNGTYLRCGKHDRVSKFVRSTRYNGRSVDFMLFRTILLNGKRRWYISIVPENQQLGTEEDIDFYKSKATSTDCNIPPRDGWIAIPSNGGANPPPRVYYTKGGHRWTYAE